MYLGLDTYVHTFADYAQDISFLAQSAHRLLLTKYAYVGGGKLSLLRDIFLASKLDKCRRNQIYAGDSGTTKDLVIKFIHPLKAYYKNLPRARTGAK